MIYRFFQVLALACAFSAAIARPAGAAEPENAPKAFIDGTGLGWRALTGNDFTNVNCAPDTWRFSSNMIYCTGQPIGVIRSTVLYTNMEVVVQWRHLKHAGNSGVFFWATPDAIKLLEDGKDRLPIGIEVQVLDPGYEENFEKEQKKKPDWFTSHGDVFPTGTAKMKPFPPAAPNGQRSFPRKRLVKPAGEWNHYYIRAVNGEVRLWVNGEEVSGGTASQPNWGYLCLESEGSPIEFKDLRIRVLP